VYLNLLIFSLKILDCHGIWKVSKTYYRVCFKSVKFVYKAMQDLLIQHFCDLEFNVKFI